MRTTLSALAIGVVVAVSARIALATTADDICPPAADPCQLATPVEVTTNSTLDFGSRAFEILPGGRLTVTDRLLTVNAGSVRIREQAQLVANSVLTGAIVEVDTIGDIRVDTGAVPGRIDATWGDVELTAGGNVEIAGMIFGKGTTFVPDGGSVVVTADGTIALTGEVNMRAETDGEGGTLDVEATGDVLVTNPSLDVSGSDGGEVDLTSDTGNVSLTTALDLDAGGLYGDGGSLEIFAEGGVSVGGSISGTAAGNIDDGGGIGAEISITAVTGAVTYSAATDVSGAPPDGGGGDVELIAGGNIVQSGNIFSQAVGIDGCGGNLVASAGGSLSLGTVRVDGNSCGGGTIFAEANGNVTLGGDLIANGDIDGGGGAIDVSGADVTVLGRVLANDIYDGFLGGTVDLAGCNVNVTSQAELQAKGAGGTNTIRASGQMTVAGDLTATNGSNVLRYRSAGVPPVIAGSASISPAPSLVLDPSLPACAVSVAVCGDGTRQAGEECDDGNTTACDGCSAVCRIESCGNGRIECDEECDLGPANGAPGSPCDASCRVVTAAGVTTIPGKHKGPAGCLVEWVLQGTTGDPEGAFPSSTQSCIDGDPACDTDGASDGVCSFAVAACLASDDPRLPACQPQAVKQVNLRRPSLTRPVDATDSANVAALLDVLLPLNVRLLAGNQELQTADPNPLRDNCSAAATFRVPHPEGTAASRQLRIGAFDTTRHRLKTNKVTLVCEPNTAVCGNGAVELGELCDDGNTTGCDGCSATCQPEGCGDGVVNCGEQCDDGPLNGTEGDPCTAACTEVPPALRIPGGGSKKYTCAFEWAMAIGTPKLNRKGVPKPTQACVDNDPTCDFDPAVGSCRFHIWPCMGGADDRISCLATTVTRVDLLRPTVKQTGAADVAARQVLLAALGQLGFPAGPEETCGPRIDLDVPAGRKRLTVKTGAVRIDGKTDRDALKLQCAVPK
jgi:cysteine-rich repeat protein